MASVPAGHRVERQFHELYSQTGCEITAGMAAKVRTPQSVPQQPGPGPQLPSAVTTPRKVSTPHTVPAR
jgi:hypothetical protein